MEATVGAQPQILQRFRRPRHNGTSNNRTVLCRLPAFRRALLLATSGARARVRHWIRTETLPPLSAAERHAWIHDRVNLYGDEDFLPIITQALVRLPDVIVDTLLPAVAFVGVGHSSIAWFARANFFHREGYRLSHVIVLGPSATDETVRHECGHAFCSRFPSESNTPAISTLGEAALRQLAVDEGWSNRIDEHEQREERLACGFACAWSPPA